MRKRSAARNRGGCLPKDPVLARVSGSLGAENPKSSREPGRGNGRTLTLIRGKTAALMRQRRGGDVGMHRGR